MIDTKAPAFPGHVARAVVRKINTHVDAMLGNSKVIEGGHWGDIDATFGLFEKHELQLGKLLGTGGFSEVYEIVGFEPSEQVNAKFGAHQVAARQFYRDHSTKKDGGSKYAVKHLRSKLMQDPTKFCMAAADLCVEAQFLSNLSHKNILKVRGWSKGGIMGYEKGKHDGYFLIVDRLSETLSDRIETWSTAKYNRSLESSFQRLGLENESTAQVLSRTKIAHQIASALEYLHSKNIVFRDLKPDNVGFDEDGTVKIFDFGLSRELPEMCKNVNDVYRMSGTIGTIRYMAPEVALSKHYNQKVDTYSWSMLYWQCLTLDKPYANMQRSSHLAMVCQMGERPVLPGDIPKSIHSLLEESWAQNISHRLTMQEVCACLESIEKELAGDLNIQITRSSSIMSRPAFTRSTSNTVVSMAA